MKLTKTLTGSLRISFCRKTIQRTTRFQNGKNRYERLVREGGGPKSAVSARPKLVFFAIEACALRLFVWVPDVEEGMLFVFRNAAVDTVPHDLKFDQP